MASARDRGRQESRSPAPAAPSAPPPPSTAALAVIRLALLLGVLTFGAMTTFILRRGDPRPPAGDALDTLRIVGIVLWAIAVLAVAFLRLRGTRIAGRMGSATPAILGWTVGEAVAIFGGVYYFLSGRPSWYLNGVLFLVATFVIFPLRRPQ